MKTKEELNALNTKFAELSEDMLAHVIGGYSTPGILDRILEELSAWLDKNPNATKSDIYNILKKKKDEYSDELTEEELNALDQLLNTFAA